MSDSRAQSASVYRVGVDIGGTFTDATLLDDATGDTAIAKVLSTPSDPERGFIEAVRSVLEKKGVEPNAVSLVVHATTVATNAIIEGTTAKTAFITTDGFRDMLEIARQMRPSLYDPQFEKPRALVPRYWCFGVGERLLPTGEPIRPVDRADVDAIAVALAKDKVDAIAVCLLHSYRNPAHEEEIGAILAAAFPETPISLSARVAPEFREYYRASTTVINASLTPIVSRYVEKIERQLADAGVAATLLIMQSNGGVYSARAARDRPVFMVESGPAAGVIAAADLGKRVGRQNVLSLDMGGTTAKACLIEDGEPRVTKDYEVGIAASAGHGDRRGIGYPIRTPVIDLVEIGAGGGSIAWVDSGGVLRVGPRSAGADPGPACYGRGGTHPTITDANVVLGRLNPDFFLGGGLKLDIERSRTAIATHCAEALDMPVIEVAHGIVEIANSAMVNALRLVSIQHGYDPRAFTLAAFGGAGPVHANRIAEEVGVADVVIPPSPGIFSSTGLLVTDLKHDYSVARVGRVEQVEPRDLAADFDAMVRAGTAELEGEGVPASAMSFDRYVDMRYAGQSYELTVPVNGAAVDRGELAAVVERFHALHEQAYGFRAADEPTEMVALRATARGAIPKPPMQNRTNGVAHVAAARAATTRSVYFAEADGFVRCPCVSRLDLGIGHDVEGPLIVEEFDSTTVVHPGYVASVDDLGNLWLRKSSDLSGRDGGGSAHA
jgi:N-methylhydantoinase A